MARLHEKPLPVRRRFALVATIIIGLVLIATLILQYATSPTSGTSARDRWADFYTTVIGKGQSLFDR